MGGGIGGLAAAAACRKVGFQPLVLERAPTFAAVGAGISLFPNAIHALDRLGAGFGVRAQGLAGGPAGLRTPDGRWLARMPVTDLEERYGAPLVVLHRADLLRVLRGAAGAANIWTGAEVVSVESRASGVVARLGDGREVEADLLVAADGIDSSVRRQIFGGDPIRPAGYVAWRSVVEVPGVNESSETWGRGERFGVVPMDGDRVYWYATAKRAEEGTLAEVRRRFGSWHHPIPALLEASRGEKLLLHEIRRLDPLQNWTKGRVALLGDAAHAMTPDNGQGGCQAIEDAVVLSTCLRREADLEGALASYERQRKPRAERIQRRSKSTGRVAQATGWGATLRDLLVGLLPSSLFIRALDPVCRWRPPEF